MREATSLSGIRWKLRRGMLELDTLLERFADEYYEQLDPDERNAFLRLLDAEDDVLWDWLTGRDRPESKGIAAIVHKIRNQH